MRNTRVRGLWIAGSTALALAAACQGQVSDEGGEDPGMGSTPSTPSTMTMRPPMSGTGGAGATMTGTGGTSGTATPIQMPPALPADRAAIPACAKGIQPGAAPVRRLNRREYNRTIADLFGVNTNLGQELHTDLPVEERRLGFDNNANVLSVSPLLTEQYMMAAEKLAVNVVENQLVARLLGGCDPATAAGGEETCWNRFVSSFVKRAYRRPAQPDEVKILRDVYDVGRQQDLKTGIKMALMTVLQSPQFLYRIEVGEPPKPGETAVPLTQYERATRLSYLLWGSQPDSTILMPAADARRLNTPEEIATVVGRMMVEGAAGMQRPHSKLKSVVKAFHDQWLDLEHLTEVEKDQKVFPLRTFPKEYLSLMQTEIDKFIDEAFWNPMTGGSLVSLLTGAFTYVDPKLYTHYGAAAGGLVGAAPMGAVRDMAATNQRVELDGVKRGGLLTQGALMVVQSNANQSSPVLRGKFIREQFLCQILPPPPNDVMVEVPALDPKFTTRERFTRHRTDPSCAGCHQLIDPIGLGLEKFDAIGKYRELENSKPIDASGEIVGMTNGKFNGAIELEKKLLGSEQAAECVARQWFRYAYGREEENADACTLEWLKRKFVASGLKFQDLLVALTQTDAFLYRRVGGAP